MAPQQQQTRANSANMNTESATPGLASSHNNRRRSRARCVIFIVVLLIFHAIILVALDLTILRARTPKYVLKSVNLTNLDITNSTTSSTIRINATAEITIKNKNFGPYKYHDCYMTFFYGEKSVGEVVVPEGSVKTLSTKKLKLDFNVSYSETGNSNLRSDISLGVLRMSSKSEMRGQVELLFKIHKKNRSPKMDCNMSINLVEKVVKDLNCNYK